MVSLLAFILVIGVSIVIHEMGHYLAAVWRGVLVHEFSFGMGPKLFGWQRGETLWALRAFPVGGFVNMEGQDDNDPDAPVTCPERSFGVKKPWERLVMLAGGAASNIFLAWVLTSLLLMFYGVNDLRTTKIGALMPDYPAQRMGLEAGDAIRSINGVPVKEWGDIRKTLAAAKTDNIAVVVERGGTEKTVTGAAPYVAESKARMLGIQPARTTFGPLAALGSGLTYCWSMSVMILQALWGMLTGTQSAEIAGPVGIAVMAGDAARQGFWMFVTFLAVINLNLGLFNLLPFPALDGGRIVFVFGEMLTGKKFPEKWENRIHYAGLLFLLLLIAFVTFKDIMRLIKS